MKCLVCEKEIIGKPIERIVSFEYGGRDIVDPKVNEEKRFFCCDEHYYTDQILTDFPFFGGNLTKTITHLIEEHDCKIEILEKVLNSGEFKSMWTEMGLRPYWHGAKKLTKKP